MCTSADIKCAAVARGGGGAGEGSVGVTASGYGVSFPGDENVLELDSDDSCMTL